MHPGEKFTIIIPPQDISCVPGLQEKLANGDRDAFAWVYKNYCKKVFDYALMMTGSEAQSEDIVQDVFIKIWMNREKMRNIDNFNGYMNMMCRNHVMNIFRANKREKKVKTNYGEKLTLSRNDVEEMINYKEANSIIAKAVKELPKCRRRMFEMKLQGMSCKEITQQLGKHPKTFHNQMHSAGKFLKERLER